jgi:hypothetical protein
MRGSGRGRGLEQIKAAATVEEVRSPIQVLSPLSVYRQGHGERGKLTWTPTPPRRP